MDNLYRIFPYDKHIMLNVLYDSLDILGFQVEKANSERGTITAKSTGETLRRFRIAFNTVSQEGKTTLQIYPEEEDERGMQLAEVLLDEITATTKRSLLPR